VPSTALRVARARADDGREITLVRDADEVLERAERGDDLGAGGKE
jgi:hypothetical protein